MASSAKEIYFTDTLIGYTVGGSGIIGKTVDGGNSLIIQSGNVIGNLNAIFFINNENGFAVGDGGAITRTTNGGLNWIPQNRITTNNLHRFIL
ncbi:MAG: hypothetical protein M3R36_05610 [Bacteroidota bacterium]|nr:hypothetical protein [Bacteroidota bacterium]